jgi:glucan phosphoethanolaminetransferase (alkaline phosphatase superfamily)
VLQSVADLVPELDGRVVVTADHGEAFGEEGVWEHHIETHIPPLVEVPWLEVETTA